MNTVSIISAIVYSFSLLWAGYEYGKGVGEVHGNVEGRKAMRKHYEQVGK